MNENTKNSPDRFGFLFHYPQFNQNKGVFRLDINIPGNPAEMHFDPQKVSLTEIPSPDRLERLTIRHPWPRTSGKTVRVAAGVIQIEDRYGNKEEAFTFGGDLSIQSSDKNTFCQLVSPAPILEIDDASPVKRLMVEEIEILLAERKAALLPAPEKYEERLANADPLELCWVLSQAMIDKFAQPAYKKEGQYAKLHWYLMSEEHRLRAAGLAKPLGLTLEKVL